MSNYCEASQIKFKVRGLDLGSYATSASRRPVPYNRLLLREIVVATMVIAKVFPR